MAEEIVIGKLIIDNSDLDRAMLESKKAVIALEDEQKNLKKETDNLSSANEDQLKTFITNEAALKKARAEYSANQKTVLALTRAQTGLDDELKKNVKTQDDAIANTKLLTEARRKIDTTTLDGAKAIAEINAKITANNKLVNDSSSALEQQKNNVGNYPTIMAGVSSSFGDATKSVIGFASKGKEIVGEFSGVINKFKEANEASTVATQAFAVAQIAETTATEAATVAEAQRVAVGFRYAQGKATETEVEIANTAATVANANATAAQATATTAGTAATNAASIATKALRVAMLAIPIVLLLALLAPLISYLTSTQEGIDKVTSVTRPLQAIFQSLIGVLQNLGKSLFEAFDNPKKAMNDLYEFVKQNLINRFTAFAVILDGIINLDFEKISNGVLQAGTGVENLTGKIANAGKQTAEFLKEAATKGAEIDRLTKEIEKDQLKYNRALEVTNDLIDEQKLKSKDSSLNIKEREKAANEIIRLTTELGVQEENIIKKKIKQLDLQQSLNDTSREGSQEMIDLEAQLNSAQDRGVDSQIEQLKVISAARKEAQAAAKTASDAAKAAANKEAKNRIDILKAEASQQKLNAEQRLANAKKIFELENDLAKKSLGGSDQKKALIQNRQALSSEILYIAQDQINLELEIQKKAFAESKKITEEQKNALLLSAEDLATAQILLLDKSLITEKDYADQVVLINKAKNEAIATANTAFDEGEKIRKETQIENEKALEEVNYQLRLQDIADKKGTEQELLLETYAQEQLLLEQSLADKKISEDVYLQKKILAEKKFAASSAKIDKILADQRNANNIKMANDAIGALQGLFGESKALSVAAALINTYEGITAGVKLGYPQAIPAVAMAAATGFAAVKNILKTTKTTTSGAENTPQTMSGTGSFVNGQTSTIAQVSDRPIEQNTIVSPPVLVLETLQEVEKNVLIKIKSD